MDKSTPSSRKRPPSSSLACVEQLVSEYEAGNSSSTNSAYESSWNEDVRNEYVLSVRQARDVRRRHANRRRRISSSSQRHQTTGAPRQSSLASAPAGSRRFRLQTTPESEYNAQNVSFRDIGPPKSAEGSEDMQVHPEVAGNADMVSTMSSAQQEDEVILPDSRDDLDNDEESHCSSVALDNNHDLGTMSTSDIGKDLEIRRLWEVLQIIETSTLSQNHATALLRTNIVNSRYSYEVLLRYAIRLCRVQKRFGFMCSSEHAPTYDELDGGTCSSSSCTKQVVDSHRYWYRLISEQLAALCRASESFKSLMEGCREAQSAMHEQAGFENSLRDYYCGSYFRERFGESLRTWEQEKELYVFLTFSSDGFEVFRGRKLSRSTWPLIFLVLNLDPRARFQVDNALLAGFVPGSHDPSEFEKFLEPILYDLKMLEKGMLVQCFDGQTRTLSVHVVFVTADWTAATKLLGFKGHNAEHPCRRCLKQGRKAIQGGTKLWMIPEDNHHVRRRDWCGELDGERSTWIDTECPFPRSHSRIRDIWGRLESKKGSKAAIMKSTGVRRRPLLAQLSIDVVRSAPYDPMHLWLLGWVKHVSGLLIGFHKKCLTETYPFVLQPHVSERINDCLARGSNGIPAEWGRPPESFRYAGGYKAEDYLNLALYFGPVIFGDEGIDVDVSRLWTAISVATNIIMDTSPTKADVLELRQAIQVCHSLFVKVFYTSPSHAFCLTPTTHAILHLPDILGECGSLRNISQFIVERIAGKLGEITKSRHRPDANLFHKTHKLFALRMIDGGLTKVGNSQPPNCALVSTDGSNPVRRNLISCRESGGRSQRSNDQSEYAEDEFDPESEVWISGRARAVEQASKHDLVLGHISEALNIPPKSVNIQTIDAFPWVSLRQRDAVITVETHAEFLRRKKEDTFNARQRCWVVGRFEAEVQQDDEVCEIFYGCIEDIWDVSAEYQQHGAIQAKSRTYKLVRIRWQYGLVEHSITNTPSVSLRPSPRRGSIRDTVTTIESLSCITHLVAFLDYGGRRYFLDPMKRRLSNGKDILGGTIR